MQHHRPAPFPLPDVVPGRAPSAPPRLPPHAPPRSPPPPATEFLIIGLFALRLALRLIEGLEYYPERSAHITWLTDFLAPFHSQCALAKICGPRKDDYIATYQDIVSRMIKQPRYPIRFMQMNPDRSAAQRGRSGAETEQLGDMTDAERLDIIDFCDAAGEWGSIVPIPAREAGRMIELADQRRIADLEEMQALSRGRLLMQDERDYLRSDGRESSREDRYYFEERRR